MDNRVIDQRNAIFFLFTFNANGATCNIFLSPKCYIGMFLMDMVGKFDILNENFFVKNFTPTLKKLKPWQVYVNYSNRVYFVECTRQQAFFKTHAYSHNFRIFQATGFQNIGTHDPSSFRCASNLRTHRGNMNETPPFVCMQTLYTYAHQVSFTMSAVNEYTYVTM